MICGKGSLNNVKVASYKEAAAVCNPDDPRFKGAYSSDAPTQTEIREALDRLKTDSCYGGKAAKGLVLLCCHLLHQDDAEKYSKFFEGGQVDIEHVCPKNWSNVDGWTQEEHDSLANTIGNLIPLERAINIQLSNSSFQKKKTGESLRNGIRPYSKSLSPEANELAEKPSDRWLPADVRSRTEKKVAILADFFCAGTISDEIHDRIATGTYHG